MEKRKARVLKARLLNLKIIQELNPKSARYIQKEMNALSSVGFLKQWWPHYQWLKKNHIDMDGITEHEKFIQLREETKSKMKVMDVQVSKQAREISKQIAL